MAKIPFGYEEIFKEDWIDPNVFVRWEKQYEAISLGEVVPIVDSSAPDNEHVIRIGNATDNDLVWLTSRTSIKIDPKTLYRIRASVRNFSGIGKVFVGIAGRNDLDTTFINPTGQNSLSNQYFVAASSHYDNDWMIVEGYFRGEDIASGYAANYLGVSHDPLKPSVLRGDVKYFRPILVANHDRQKGITLFGTVTVEAVKMIDAQANSMISVLQQVKSTMDPDSFVYIFPDHAIAMSRPYMEKRYALPTTGDTLTYTTLYQESIMKQMATDKCLAIYYKNTRGKWVDYMKIRMVYPFASPFQIAESEYRIFQVLETVIPEVEYTDKDGLVHFIDSCDGQQRYTKRDVLLIDELDSDIVKISQHSISQPELSFSLRHLMQDLKVELSNVSASSVLVWLNGVFVPIVRDSVKDNMFYIPDAMSILPVVTKDQRPGSPRLLRTDETGNPINATVLEDESVSQYRYDIKMRAFSWKDVTVSDWLRPIDVVTYPIVKDAAAVYVIKELYFPQEVNVDAHFIFLNGMALMDHEYYIDPNDKRHVILKTVEYRGYALLREAIEKGLENPIEVIRPLLTDRSYALVNFSSTSSSPVLMRKFKSCAVDFPYRNEVTFTSLSLGDLVLVDGLYVPYEWVHKNTIRYPTMRYSYEGITQRMKRQDFVRFVFTDKE